SNLTDELGLGAGGDDGSFPEPTFDSSALDSGIELDASPPPPPLRDASPPPPPIDAFPPPPPPIDATPPPPPPADAGCGPTTCPRGCCQHDGTCFTNMGVGPGPCGTNGEQCIQCNQTCFMGACGMLVNNCGPSNCKGCCAGTGACS